MSNVWITDKDFSCSLAATSNITLSGLYTLDGVAITAGMFILAAAQTDPVESGPYIARVGAWDRIISLSTGQQFYISLGSTNATKIYELQTPTPFTVGTTALSFVTPIVSGVAPSGAAGGSLSGTYPNPSIANSGVTAATYPTAGSIPQLIIGADGRVTSASSVTDGSALTALNASNLSTGTVDVGRIPSAIPAASIGTGTVDNTEFGYLDGVTSAIQGQFTGKLDTTSTKLNPTPTAAGKLIYDTGSVYAETAAGTSGQVLQSNGASAPSWVSVPFPVIDIQVYTSGSGTWTRPSTGNLVDIVCIGGGGGGGSGRRGGVTNAYGGASGAGGGYSRITLKRTDLGATESYVVGAGGAGGAAVTSDTTNGNIGTAGGASNFGTWLKSGGGGPGNGGTNTLGASTGGSAGTGQFPGGAGQTNDGSTNAGGATNFAPTGGGQGGGVQSGGFTYGSSASSVAGGLNYTAAAGGGNGANGTNGTSPGGYSSGGGGGGGGGPALSVGGNGGSGGLYGGGGGGGGGSAAGSNSGSGGTGGNGVVIVITY